ncbi:MAG: hypothetical protein ABEI58_02030 [Candidatus Nanohaloarchaea archaeon]
MDHRDAAILLIGLSVLTGLFLASQTVFRLPQVSFDDIVLGQLDEEDLTGKDSVPEKVHEHALFYTVVNGTELNFTAPAYQYNSPYVHLENGRSHIVHKHVENATWNQFLATINVSVVYNSSRYCLKTINVTRCGNGTVILNDQKNPDLDQVIQQGDKLLIVIQDNVSEVIDEYALKQLPPEYTPGFGHSI